MEEREIVAVEPVDEDDWAGAVECMSATETMGRACTREADKDIHLKYEDEPDKTFHTLLCEECAADYVKKWDRAQIYGDEALEDDNPFKVK